MEKELNLSKRRETTLQRERDLRAHTPRTLGRPVLCEQTHCTLCASSCPALQRPATRDASIALRNAWPSPRSPWPRPSVAFCSSDTADSPCVTTPAPCRSHKRREEGSRRAREARAPLPRAPKAKQARNEDAHDISSLSKLISSLLLNPLSTSDSARGGAACPHSLRLVLDDSKRSAEEEAAKRAELSAKFEGCFKVRSLPLVPPS